VGWKSYHDQWLSEGFAQFSAGLYAQKAQGEKKYKTFLETDRQMILSQLPQATIRANDAGPIWMGWRLETDKTPGAYNLVYTKGGFILHMLRMLLYDYTRNDDTRFVGLMRDFVQTYYNKNASTEDFKAICDKHFRSDMGWFFRQWVYGTDLPKISVEYSFANEADGVVVWKVDIKQHNVPAGFVSSLPFTMRTKAGVLSGRLQAPQLTNHLEVKLKEKPESVEINPLYGWLCDLDVKKH
jgi:aminopeptidase N